MPERDSRRKKKKEIVKGARKQTQLAGPGEFTRLARKSSFPNQELHGERARAVTKINFMAHFEARLGEILQPPLRPQYYLSLFLSLHTTAVEPLSVSNAHMSGEITARRLKAAVLFLHFFS